MTVPTCLKIRRMRHYAAILTTCVSVRKRRRKENPANFFVNQCSVESSAVVIILFCNVERFVGTFNKSFGTNDAH